MINDLPDGAGLAATDAAACARPRCCIRIQQSLRGMVKVMVVIEVTLVLVRMVMMAVVVTLAVMMMMATLGKLIVLA